MERGAVLRFKMATLGSSLAVVLVLDQWTKWWAVRELKNTPVQSFLGGLVKLVYAENYGAWGSLGGNWSFEWRFLLLILVPIGILVGLCFYIFGGQHKKMEIVSLCLILAGGVGNLVDRVRFQYVVDMFWMGFSGTVWQTNVFNVADVAIMTGFCILFGMGAWQWMKRQKTRR